MKSPVPERIEGQGFFLRRWRVEDAGWYVAARDEEIFRWTTERQDLTQAEAEEAIRKVNDSPEALCFAIVVHRAKEQCDEEQSTQDLLGNIALRFDPTNSKEAEIMYWLAPSARGRGIATIAVALLCEWAFQSIGLDRVTLKTLRGNIRSQRVAERAGFRLLMDQSGKGLEAETVWFEQSAGQQAK